MCPDRNTILKLSKVKKKKKKSLNREKLKLKTSKI